MSSETLDRPLDIATWAAANYERMSSAALQEARALRDFDPENIAHEAIRRLLEQARTDVRLHDTTAQGKNYLIRAVRNRVKDLAQAERRRTRHEQRECDAMARDGADGESPFAMIADTVTVEELVVDRPDSVSRMREVLRLVLAFDRRIREALDGAPELARYKASTVGRLIAEALLQRDWLIPSVFPPAGRDPFAGAAAEAQDIATRAPASVRSVQTRRSELLRAVRGLLLEEYERLRADCDGLVPGLFDRRNPGMI